MEYWILDFKYSDYPELLNRKIAVRPCTKLFDLNLYLLISLKSAIYHLSEFENENAIFAYKYSIDENMYILKKKVFDFEKKTLRDLFKNINETISFIYDFGANYEFKINFIKTCEFPFKRHFILLDAKGDGIFEDDKSNLNSFLSGELPKSEIYAWNLKIKDLEKYDYFKKIDVETFNENLPLDFKMIKAEVTKEE